MRNASAALVACVLFSNPAFGQRTTITYYHGARSAGSPSGLIVSSPNGGYQRSGENSLTRRVPTGAEVCIQVANAHPLNYTYTLSRTVDTVSRPLPDMSGIVKLIAPLLQPTDGPASAPDALPDATARNTAIEAVTLYADRLDGLKRDVRQTRDELANSDAPELISQLESPIQAGSLGYRAALARIRAMPPESGRFNDPSLRQTLHGWQETARRDASSDPHLAGLVELLAAQSDQLASEVELLRKTLDNTSPVAMVCEKVGNGPTTIRLNVVRKPGTNAVVRDTGANAVVELVARPPYDRPAIGVHPVAFMTTGFDVPDFRVVNGTLHGDEGYASSVRAGAVVNFHLLSFMQDGEAGLGIGLGAGTRGTADLISDFFVGPILSYREDIRIGLGIGASDFPRRVRGSAVGEEFSASGELSDLVEQDKTLALQIIFVLPGLKLQ